MRSANSVRMLYIGCALLMLASAAPPQALAQSGSDAVEQVIKDFLVPFSNRNIREFIEYFADDATVFLPSAPGPGFPADRVQGKPQSRESSKQPISALERSLGQGARSSSLSI